LSIKKVVSVVSVVLLISVVAALGYRAWRQHEGDLALAVDPGIGVDEGMFVPINGTEQWVAIHGQDRKRPVVLILHGGPGFSTYPMMTQLLPFESSYVVAHWDQPGTARTFARAGDLLPADLSIADYVADGISVAEFLRTHLHQDKIVLLGWSWGSILGVEMIRARPDLFSAYVGTGQVVSMQEGEPLVYLQVLEEARRRGDVAAVEELEAIGAPPYASPMSDTGIQRRWAMKFEGTDLPFIVGLPLLAPRYSLADARSFFRGVRASGDHFIRADNSGEMMGVDLAAEGSTFQVPFLVIHGSEDNWIPAELAEAWLTELNAPRKEFVSMEGAGHFAFLLQPERFVAIMNAQLRGWEGTPTGGQAE